MNIALQLGWTTQKANLLEFQEDSNSETLLSWHLPAAVLLMFECDSLILHTSVIHVYEVIFNYLLNIVQFSDLSIRYISGKTVSLI